MKQKFLLFFLISIAFSCSKQQKSLPSMGKMEREFKFVSQDGKPVTPADIENKIYVTDFFFTTCPTICPIMKSQMIRLYERYEGNPNFILLSHSIDQNDSVEVLKAYANGLGIDSKKWLMVTGERSEIFETAKAYMESSNPDGEIVGVDAKAPGGYIHSGAFILMDGNRNIRGYYDGTKEEEVNELMTDIDLLLNGEDR
jgi:protein SCO1/2